MTAKTPPDAKELMPDLKPKDQSAAMPDVIYAWKEPEKFTKGWSKYNDEEGSFTKYVRPAPPCDDALGFPIPKTLKDLQKATDADIRKITQMVDVPLPPTTCDDASEDIRIKAFQIFAENFKGTVNHRHATAMKAVSDFYERPAPISVEVLEGLDDALNFYMAEGKPDEEIIGEMGLSPYHEKQIRRIIEAARQYAMIAKLKGV